jgi:hypothetical protein
VYFRAAFTARERNISFLLQLCVKNTFWFQLRQCQIFLFFVALSHSSGNSGAFVQEVAPADEPWTFRSMR